MRIETFLPYRLAVVAEAFSRRLFAVYGQQHGFTREEWRLLFLLDDARSLDSLRLSRRTSLDKVQVSRAASRLEKRGLISREVLETDRRLRNYMITDAGRTLFGRAFGEVEARSAQILGAMSDQDRDALLRGLEALGRAVASTRDGEDQDMVPDFPGDSDI